MKTAYLATSVSQERIEENNDNCITEEDSLKLEDSPELPPVTLQEHSRELQVSLYPEAADGFGQWPILIVSSAISTLRVLAKRDPKSYEILMKKLK